MKRTNRFLSLILLASLVGQAHGMSDTLVMTGRSVISPESLGRVALLFKDGAYSAVRNGVTQGINSFDVSPILRSANTAKLITLVKSGGALALTKMSNGDLRLALAPCLKGGGPVVAGIAYWATKSLCYGFALVGVGTLVVGGTLASGGLAGGIAIATAAPGLAAPTLAATVIGATATAETVAASGLITTGIVSSSGGIAAAMMNVEALALGASALACALPTP